MLSLVSDVFTGICECLILCMYISIIKHFYTFTRKSLSAKFYFCTLLEPKWGSNRYFYYLPVVYTPLFYVFTYVVCNSYILPPNFSFVENLLKSVLIK